MRYTLNSRPVMSLSNSNRLLRSMEVLELEQSSPLKQRCDREAAAGACSATAGPEVLTEFLPRGGGGDLRYTLDSRPVTSLRNSKRPTRSTEGSCPPKQRGDVEAIFLPLIPWGRLLGDWSVVPVMVLGEMKRE